MQRTIAVSTEMAANNLRAKDDRLLPPSCNPFGGLFEPG
jgi:hypothetical protein